MYVLKRFVLITNMTKSDAVVLWYGFDVLGSYDKSVNACLSCVMIFILLVIFISIKGSVTLWNYCMRLIACNSCFQLSTRDTLCNSWFLILQGRIHCPINWIQFSLFPILVTWFHSLKSWSTWNDTFFYFQNGRQGCTGAEKRCG